ncbi:MAG: DUF3775 domain-containing protein [Rhodospirillaceae bacterium]
MDLGLNPDKACFIVVKAREWAAQTGLGAPTEASNPLDDGFATSLYEDGYDPEVEIRAVLDDLNEAEELTLLALALVGRGTHDKENWADALRDARDVQSDGDGAVAARLLDMPLLPDYLEEGLAAFGYSCTDTDTRSEA